MAKFARVSPHGGWIAFLQHPIRHDDAEGCESSISTQGWWRPMAVERRRAGVDPPGDEFGSPRRVTAGHDRCGGSAWWQTRLVGRRQERSVLRDGCPDGTVVCWRGKRGGWRWRVGWMATRRSGVYRGSTGRGCRRCLRAAPWCCLTKAERRLVGSHGISVRNAITPLFGWVTGCHGLSPTDVGAVARHRSDAIQADSHFGGSGARADFWRMAYQWAHFFPDGRRLLALAMSRSMVCGFWVFPGLRGRAVRSRCRSLRRWPCAMRRFADGTQIAVLSGRWQVTTVPTTGEPAVVPFGSRWLLLPVQCDGQWLLVQHLKSSRSTGLWCRACISEIGRADGLAGVGAGGHHRREFDHRRGRLRRQNRTMYPTAGDLRALPGAGLAVR